MCRYTLPVVCLCLHCHQNEAPLVNRSSLRKVNGISMLVLQVITHTRTQSHTTGYNQTGACLRMSSYRPVIGLTLLWRVIADWCRHRFAIWPGLLCVGSHKMHQCAGPVGTHTHTHTHTQTGPITIHCAAAS